MFGCRKRFGSIISPVPICGKSALTGSFRFLSVSLIQTGTVGGVNSGNSWIGKKSTALDSLLVLALPPTRKHSNKKPTSFIRLFVNAYQSFNFNFVARLLLRFSNRSVFWFFIRFDTTTWKYPNWDISSLDH